MLRFLVISIVGLFLWLPLAGAQQFCFGVEDVVGAAEAGPATILLAAPARTTTWSASSDAAWLQVQTASGTGNSLVRYSLTANPDRRPRTAKITVGSATVSVTQVGAYYRPAGETVTLVGTGLSKATNSRLAVDAAGNLYVSDFADRAIKKWTRATGGLSTLVSAGLEGPSALTLNRFGDVVFSDWAAGAVKRWRAVDGAVGVLIADVLATGVAFEADGRVLVCDMSSEELRRLDLQDGTASTVCQPAGWQQGVAVDACGDILVAANNGDNWGVVRYVPGSDTGSPVVYSWSIYGVAADGAGNVFFTEWTGPSGAHGSVLSKWSAATGTIEQLGVWSSGLVGMAVDARGNVFVADSAQGRLLAIPDSWVDPTPQYVGAGAGSIALPPVLPLATDLTGVFAPVSDRPWLTVDSVTGGVVRFAYTANTSGTDRTAHLTVLGQKISVTQSAGLVTLGARATVVGPTASRGTVLVAASSSSTQWFATAGAMWLHLDRTGGTGDALLGFSYDANPDAAPRTGVVSIGGAAFTVTQAGEHYEVVDQYFPLATTGLGGPKGLAVDVDGNVVLADYQNGQIKKWWARTGEVSTLVSSGLDGPDGVALDPVGNVLIADSRNNAIKRWRVTDGVIETLVGSGLARPAGAAVARNGDVLIADSEHNAIKRWSAADGQVSTVVGTGLNTPGGVAVDLLGNVSFADRFNYRTKQWSAAEGIVRDLWEHDTHGVAADGLGNVLIATGQDVARWSAATGDASVLATVGAGAPFCVAVDKVGNLYFSASMGAALYELPQAYVDTTPRLASSGQWTESFAPVLALSPNLTGAFVPTSDQPWLVIDKGEGGRITYHTQYNISGSARTGHLTVLGKAIAVTQQTSDSWTYVAFQQWNFTPAECADPTVSGPLADPSGRGVCNLLAYALGLDPRNPASAGLPQASIIDGVFQFVFGDDGLPVLDENGNYKIRIIDGVPQLKVRACSMAADVALVVEVSSDLVHWETTPALVATDSLDSVEEERIYQDLSGAEAVRRFMRVRVTKR